MAAKFWKTAGGAALLTGDLLLRRKFRRIKPVLKPKAIQKIGDQLAIAWSEGQETYIPLETLRRACPCASCGGEPDVLGRLIRPKVLLFPDELRSDRVGCGGRLRLATTLGGRS